MSDAATPRRTRETGRWNRGHRKLAAEHLMIIMSRSPCQMVEQRYGLQDLLHPHVTLSHTRALWETTSLVVGCCKSSMERGTFLVPPFSISTPARSSKRYQHRAGLRPRGSALCDLHRPVCHGQLCRSRTDFGPGSEMSGRCTYADGLMQISLWREGICLARVLAA